MQAALFRPVAAMALLAALAGPAHAAPAPPLFSNLLPDVPGKRLTVVNLILAPMGSQPARPHRHPGSVYVYVTKGTARLGIEGQPPQIVHTGESFFEAPGVLHTVSESASPTEPATAIAVMIVPDGAALSTPEPAR